MKLRKLLICVCCAGLIFITGCEGGSEPTDGETAASGSAASTSAIASATVRPIFTAKPTITRPTPIVTEKTPAHTLPTNTPAPTPSASAPVETPALFPSASIRIPILPGAEFLRPSEEEIARLKERYKEAYEKATREQGMLKYAIVSFEDACVEYVFYDHVFRDYDWSKGMPGVEDVRAYMSLENTGYRKEYRVPIYSRSGKLIAVMEYDEVASDHYYTYFREIEDNREINYCFTLPTHTRAYYAYREANSKNIKNMILFSEVGNYAYCVVETDSGSYIYDYGYLSDSGLGHGSGQWPNTAARPGYLYRLVSLYRGIYMQRLDNWHFIDGVGAA